MAAYDRDIALGASMTEAELIEAAITASLRDATPEISETTEITADSCRVCYADSGTFPIHAKLAPGADNHNVCLRCLDGLKRAAERGQVIKCPTCRTGTAHVGIGPARQIGDMISWRTGSTERTADLLAEMRARELYPSPNATELYEEIPPPPMSWFGTSVQVQAPSRNIGFAEFLQNMRPLNRESLGMIMARLHTTRTAPHAFQEHETLAIDFPASSPRLMRPWMSPAIDFPASSLRLMRARISSASELAAEQHMGAHIGAISDEAEEQELQTGRQIAALFDAASEPLD